MSITTLPPAPAASDDPSVFNTRAIAFVGALSTMVSEINADIAVQNIAAAAVVHAVAAKAAPVDADEMPLLDSAASFALKKFTWANLKAGLFAAPPAIGSTTPAAGSFTQINSGPLAGFRNAVINGGFDVWQRGTSFSGSVYAADRWTTLTDATVTTSQQAFTPGSAPAAGCEGTYYLRQVKSGGTYAITEQRIEDVRTYAGQVVTLSFWARADASVNSYVLIGQNFGTGGSPSSAVEQNSTITITTSWVKYSYAVTLGSLSGKTLGSTAGTSYVYVRPIRVVDAGAHTIDVWGVQLEPGPIYTPFEHRPIGVELALCRRYYRASSYYVPATTAQNLAVMDMRAVPTIAGGGTGFTSTGTTADTLIAYQTTGAVQALTLTAEL